mgnify:CR=1 FL=1
MTPIEEVQCCGLGGCAPVKEPELAKNMGAVASVACVFGICRRILGVFTWLCDADVSFAQDLRCL